MSDSHYWVRVSPGDAEWQIGRWMDGGWFLIGVADEVDEVSEVGPAIPTYAPGAD
jgi:hypothetical protein